MNIAEKYLIEALDEYPYNVKAAMEALDYVFSYDDEIALAYCLLGEIYAGHMGDYHLAIENFEYALHLDSNTWRVYPSYISALMALEEYNKAVKVIDYAMKVKSVDKSLMWGLRAIIEEYKLNFKEALKHLKVGKNYAVIAYQLAYLEEIKTRVKNKMPKKKSKKKKKSKEKVSDTKKAA